MQKVIHREHIHPDGTIGRAVFSEDQRYRYMLTRTWSDNPALIFVMLNPSIGDEKKLETTTAGCMARARNWHYGGIIVVNLFAYIATDPKELLKAEEPVGEHNDFFIQYMNVLAATAGSTLVCAWGRLAKFKDREQEVLNLLHMPLHALDINKDGSPRHPLHMSHKIEPKIWLNNS